MDNIGVIDYGSGNFTSVWNALDSITHNLIVVKSENDFSKCSHIVLPGVGAFGACMQKLEAMNIINELNKSVIEQKKPFLGICVGMQVLAEFGTEFGKYDGLNWVKGYVEKIPVNMETLPLPHMGWNSLISMFESPLFKGMDEDATFYFVHSYYLKLVDHNIKAVQFDYGGTFTAAISHENIHGVQFHPEKSQYYGIQLLKNFISL